jgi:hypothetical protein
MPRARVLHQARHFNERFSAVGAYLQEVQAFARLVA